MDRRHFLGGVLGLVLGKQPLLEAANPRTSVEGRQYSPWADDAAHAQYLADLAVCDQNTLGIPRHQSLVEEGLHPVSADRVLVIDDAELRRLRAHHRPLKRWLARERVRWPATPQMPPAKLDLCVGHMERLTTHYQRPDLFWTWSRTHWRREMLGTTGMGHGMGLLHDFQPCGTMVRTTNAVVDWWLVLFPGGVDWQALDDQPVYFMVGPVMEERQPGRYLRVLEAISRGMYPFLRSEGFEPSAWVNRLASLSQADLAREFNFTVTWGLCSTRRP